MHARPPSYDAIVVGARAAGAATAMLLARAGLRVLVVDRAPYGADTLSTHALMRGGVLQLHRWGLLDRVIAAGTPPIRRTRFIYGRDRVDITIKPSYGVDALYAPRRTVLDPILVDAARDAGADIRYGITVTDVRRDPRHRVTGIVGRDELGRAFVADADIVIGADGLRSTIAGRVSAPIERRGTGATAIVYGYWSDLETDGYEWIFRPDATAGLIATNGGQTCVFVGATPGRVCTGRIEVVREILTAAAPDVAARVAAATPPTGVRTFGGRPGFIRHSWGPGWALVGDAGYWKDPLSAHGLTDALRDAELLARAITSSEPGGHARAEALADYQATRDRLSAPLFDTVDIIASHRWTRGRDPRPAHAVERGHGRRGRCPRRARRRRRGMSDPPTLTGTQRRSDEMTQQMAPRGRRNRRGALVATTAALMAATAVAVPQPAHGERTPRPEVPADLTVPAGHKAFAQRHAVGTQNYVCRASGSGFAWTLFGPQATLFGDDGDQVMTHFLSPNPDENGTAPRHVAALPRFERGVGSSCGLLDRPGVRRARGDPVAQGRGRRRRARTVGRRQDDGDHVHPAGQHRRWGGTLDGLRRGDGRRRDGARALRDRLRLLQGRTVTGGARL